MATIIIPKLPRTANAITRLNTPSITAQCTFKNSFLQTSRQLSTSYNISRQQTHNHASHRQASSSLSIARRHYATATPTRPLPSSQTPAASPANLLTWDQFLAMRRRRRFANIGTSVVFAVAFAIFGSPLIGEFEIDTKVAQATGFDSLGIIAAGSLVVAVSGWFVGRLFGGVCFSIMARLGGWSRIFAEKEKSLFSRIKRFRADPSSSSPQNPIPDYYGEKIGSVKDYRSWLKDQKAFTKKMYRDKK